ncbi:MAG: aminotransferase class I/II-fold pyridoxal phosphate-dependent enzyme [Actinomycetia bacterium]|nr:aminotransferase class I/II-fold pyridoxal phosphate-dependent enzyme [Actinomycetes bacterium]
MNIHPFRGLGLLAEAKQRESEGAKIWHFSAGEPEHGAPPAVRRAMHSALDNRSLGYTEAVGMPAVREKIQEHLFRKNDVDVPIDRILVTSGASVGLLMTLHVLAARSPEPLVPLVVGLVVPYYSPYLQLVHAVRGAAQFIRPADPRFVTVADIEAAHAEKPLRALILNSPSNPSGMIIPRAELRRITDFAAAHNITIVSDEIYHGITYDETPATSMLEMGDSAIVLNGFSKYFCMTGWRLGWLITPPDWQADFIARAQQFFVAPSALAQWAALDAFLDYDLLNQRVERYQRARDLLIAGLASWGLHPPCAPAGAFYLYVDITSMGLDSERVAELWLREAGVSVVPGLDFDEENGGQFVRFSYACGPDNVQGGIDALNAWFSQR